MASHDIRAPLAIAPLVVMPGTAQLECPAAVADVMRDALVKRGA